MNDETFYDVHAERLSIAALDLDMSPAARTVGLHHWVNDGSGEVVDYLFTLDPADARQVAAAIFAAADQCDEEAPTRPSAGRTSEPGTCHLVDCPTKGQVDGHVALLGQGTAEEAAAAGETTTVRFGTGTWEDYTGQVVRVRVDDLTFVLDQFVVGGTALEVAEPVRRLLKALAQHRNDRGPRL